MNPFNIREQSKYAKNKTTNPPNFEQRRATKAAVKNLRKLKQIQASHCEDGLNGIENYGPVLKVIR